MAVRDTAVLSAPTVIVNNVTIPIKPNSLNFTYGLGENQVRVQSGGGGTLQAVYANDVSTRLSMIQWEMESTIANTELLREWKQNSASGITNNIRVIDQTTGETFSFNNCVIENDPEINFGVDGMFSLEWKGDPVT